MNTMQLRCKMLINHDTCNTLADKLGLSTKSVQNKLNGKNEWTLRELKDLRKIYNLTDADVIEIFF